MLLKRPKTPRFFTKKDKDRDPWESPFVSFFNEDGADSESLSSPEQRPGLGADNGRPRFFPVTPRKVSLSPEKEEESREAALDALFWGPRPEAISFSRLNAAYEAQIQKLPRQLPEKASNQERTSTLSAAKIEKTLSTASQREEEAASSSPKAHETRSYRASTAWSKRYLERFVERTTPPQIPSQSATALGHSDETAILLEEDPASNEAPTPWPETSLGRRVERKSHESFIVQDEQDSNFPEEEENSSSGSSGLPPQIRQSGEAYLAQARHYLEEFAEEPKDARNSAFVESRSSRNPEALRFPNQDPKTQEGEGRTYSSFRLRAEQTQRQAQESCEHHSGWQETTRALDLTGEEPQARLRTSLPDEDFFPSFPRRRVIPPQAEVPEPSADPSFVQRGKPDNRVLQNRTDFFPAYPRKRSVEINSRSEAISSRDQEPSVYQSPKSAFSSSKTNQWEPQPSRIPAERFFPSSANTPVSRNDFFQKTGRIAANSPFSHGAPPPPQQEEEFFSNQNSFTSEDVFFPEALGGDEFLNEDEFSGEAAFPEENFSHTFEGEQRSAIHPTSSAIRSNSEGSFFPPVQNRPSMKGQPSSTASNFPSSFPRRDSNVQRLASQGYSDLKEERANVRPSPCSEGAFSFDQQFVSPQKRSIGRTEDEGSSSAPIEPQAAPHASRNTFLRRLFSRKKTTTLPPEEMTPESPKAEEEAQGTQSAQNFHAPQGGAQIPQPYQDEQAFRERSDSPQTLHTSGNPFNQPLEGASSRRAQAAPRSWQENQGVDELSATHYQTFRDSSLARQPDDSDFPIFQGPGFPSQEAQFGIRHQDTRMQETGFDRFDPHQRLFEAKTMFQPAHPQAPIQNAPQQSGFQQAAESFPQRQPDLTAFSEGNRSDNAGHWSFQQRNKESLRQFSPASPLTPHQAFSSSEVSPQAHPEAFESFGQSRPSYKPDATTNLQGYGNTSVEAAYQAQAPSQTHQEDLPAASPHPDELQINPQQKLFEADPQGAAHIKPQAEALQTKQPASQTSSPPPLPATPLMGSFSSVRRRLFSSDAFLTIVLAAGVLLFCVLLLWGISRRGPASGAETPLIKIPSPKVFKIRPEEPHKPLIPYQDELIYGELDPKDKAETEAVSERLLPMPSFAPDLVIEEEPSEDEYLDDVLAPYQSSENENTSHEKATEKAPQPSTEKPSRNKTAGTPVPPQPKQARTPTKTKERTLTRSTSSETGTSKSSSETSVLRQGRAPLSASLKEQKPKALAPSHSSEQKTAKRTSVIQPSNKALSRTSSETGRSTSFHAMSNVSKKSPSKVSSPLSAAEKGFKKPSSKTAKVASQKSDRDPKPQSTPQNPREPSRSQIRSNASAHSSAPLSQASTSSPFYVQLGILPTIESARKESARLVSKYRILAQQKLIVRPVKTEEGKTIFRLLVGPFSSRVEADKISQTLGMQFKILR